MRFDARRKEEQATSDTKSSGTPIPEKKNFNKLMQNVRTRVGGWWDEAVYSGLIAIADIHGLGACLPEFEFL